MCDPRNTISQTDLGVRGSDLVLSVARSNLHDMTERARRFSFKKYFSVAGPSDQSKF